MVIRTTLNIEKNWFEIFVFSSNLASKASEQASLRLMKPFTIALLCLFLFLLE